MDIEDFFSVVDVVYIASPHETHYNYIKAALEHGKHVLCEKPMVMQGIQAEKLFNYVASTRNLPAILPVPIIPIRCICCFCSRNMVLEMFLVRSRLLCEKPMVMQGIQAEKLFNYAKERGLILFEGIKTAYCPGFSRLLGIACSGTIGSVRNVEACFTKQAVFHQGASATMYPFVPAIRSLPSDFTPNPQVAVAIPPK